MQNQNSNSVNFHEPKMNLLWFFAISSAILTVDSALSAAKIMTEWENFKVNM